LNGKFMTTYHPKLDEHGAKVVLKNPSQPSPLSAWSSPSEVATVIPNGALPAALNGITLNNWTDAPTALNAWEELAAHCKVDEPVFTPPPHKKHAAGVVIEESDGRIWLMSPSNSHGGYINTLPKGQVDPGASKQATAIKEAFEESGLHVELTEFLIDADRTTSYTRYYRAKRIGGNPADMGWESQAIHLVPRNMLNLYLTHPSDQPLLKQMLKEKE
jgi:ADP-ribose pyrophosphatase YjhB (NUDIX family)